MNALADQMFRERTGLTRQLTNKPADLHLRREWFQLRDTASRTLGYWPPHGNGRGLSLKQPEQRADEGY